MYLVVSLLLLIKAARFAVQLPACESNVYCSGDLLSAVQTARVFEDSKQFVDLPIAADPGSVLQAYSLWTNKSQQGLAQFISHWFLEPGSDLFHWIPPDWSDQPQFLSEIVDVELRQWAASLNQLWKQFGRKVKDDVKLHQNQYSLLYVPHPFIVPGGRFREFYYWDSYWIIQGLLISNMTDTARGMIENMAYLVDRYGLVPNGGRVYYTRRSQPPLLTQMAWLYFTTTGNFSFIKQMLPSLEHEYQFWMNNRSVTVHVKNSTSSLNQYRANLTTPRPESFREDLALVSETNNAGLYSQIASAAESGWDFSSRWQSSPEISSIHTSTIVPVDLNAVLCQTERTLEQFYRLTGAQLSADKYRNAWSQRQVVFDRIFWNEDAGLWQDWDLVTSTNRLGYYGSSLVPLMWGCGGDNVTRQLIVMRKLKSLGLLNYPGSIPTSLNSSSEQQWDYPNVWAPLPWFLVAGWHNSSSAELRAVARMVADQWIQSVYTGWQNHNHTMFEKYDCRSVGNPGGGGEYTVQSGFGWTNGIALHYLQLFPDLQLATVSTATAWITTVLLVFFLFTTYFLCTLGCWQVYHSGKRRYWARVRHEHYVHSTTSSSPTSPTVYENQAAISEQQDLLIHPSPSTSSSSASSTNLTNTKVVEISTVLQTNTGDTSTCTIFGNPLADEDAVVPQSYMIEASNFAAGHMAASEENTQSYNTADHASTVQFQNSANGASTVNATDCVVTAQPLRTEIHETIQHEDSTGEHVTADNDGTRIVDI